MDRTLVYETKGRKFESCWGLQIHSLQINWGFMKVSVILGGALVLISIGSGISYFVGFNYTFLHQILFAAVGAIIGFYLECKS